MSLEWLFWYQGELLKLHHSLRSTVGVHSYKQEAKVLRLEFLFMY